MKRIMQWSSRCAILSAALGAPTAPALAADKELLDILLGNGAITQQQYDELLAKEELSAADVEDVRVSLDSGGLQVEGEGFEFTLGGRLHQDYATHSYDSRIGQDPVNGSQTRRARLELDGVLHENWGWAAEVDFQDNEVSVKDFKVGWEDENFTLYVGSQKQPYSLSVEMSSNDIPFVERSIDNYLVIPFTDRAIGVRADVSGDNWFLAAGLFGDRVSPGSEGDEGWGPSARFVYAPLIRDDAVVHLGLRGQWREIDASAEIEIRDETKEDLSQLHIVDALITDSESISFVGPEVALAYGPVSLFGEYTDAGVDRSSGQDLDFSAWHVFGAWSITGESRAENYAIDAGEFKGLVPHRDFSPASGGWGAWEVAARFASLDLNNGSFVGGSEEALSTALNWYPNRNIRFMFDWTHILDTDESSQLRLHAEGMDIYSLRAQYAW